MAAIEVGESVPLDTAHVSVSIPASQDLTCTDAPQAVSVSLPSWAANVAYEEGLDWVKSKMKTGYPRYPQIASVCSICFRH